MRLFLVRLSTYMGEHLKKICEMMIAYHLIVMTNYLNHLPTNLGTFVSVIAKMFMYFKFSFGMQQFFFKWSGKFTNIDYFAMTASVTHCFEHNLVANNK